VSEKAVFMLRLARSVGLIGLGVAIFLAGSHGWAPYGVAASVLTLTDPARVFDREWTTYAWVLLTVATVTSLERVGP
jgi:hypothetical protein